MEMKDGLITHNGQTIAKYNMASLDFNLPAKPKVKLTKRAKKALKAERNKYKPQRNSR